MGEVEQHGGGIEFLGQARKGTVPRTLSKDPDDATDIGAPNRFPILERWEAMPVDEVLTEDPRPLLPRSCVSPESPLRGMTSRLRRPRRISFGL